MNNQRFRVNTPTVTHETIEGEAVRTKLQCTGVYDPVIGDIAIVRSAQCYCSRLPFNSHIVWTGNDGRPPKKTPDR